MIRLFLSILIAFTASPCLAASIIMDVDEDVIAISAGFAGQDLTIFGIAPGYETIDITITGPVKDATVRKKSRILGAWMNTKSHTYQDVPSYFAYTDKPKRIEAYVNNPEVNNEENKDFRDAFIRNQEVKNLYVMSQQTVKIYEDTGLFNVHLKLPANLPIGEYTITAHGDNNSTLAMHRFRVKHTGMNAKLRHFAFEHSFFYALVCITLAVGAGWISNRLRRPT